MNTNRSAAEIATDSNAVTLAENLHRMEAERNQWRNMADRLAQLAMGLMAMDGRSMGHFATLNACESLKAPRP